MRITYYSSNKFVNTVTANVSEILMQDEPEYMTDEIREEINAGRHTPMMNSRSVAGNWVAVPVEFVIKIEG